MNLIAVRALIKNDLRIYTTNRRAMVLGVLVPILIAAFFGYVFGGTGSREMAKIPIAITDEDASEVSRAIVAELSHDALVTVQILGRAQAEQQVKAGTVQVAVVIPMNFAVNAARALLDGRGKPGVEFLTDPSKALSGQIVESVLLRRAIPEITAAARRVQKSEAPGPFSVPYAVSITKVTSAGNIPYNGYAHSFAGMTMQFMLLAGIDAGIALLLVRERGIWQRVRAAPIGKAQFLAARVSAGMLVSLFQFIVIYLVAIGIFGVRIQGSLIGFVLLAVLLCFMNSAFGLMLASIGQNAAATRGIAVFVTLLLVMIGGAWVPSFVFPNWLQQASLVFPTRWAVDGLDAMTWRGQDLHAALAPIAVLSVTSILCIGVAIWRFRWEE